MPSWRKSGKRWAEAYRAFADSGAQSWDRVARQLGFESGTAARDAAMQHACSTGAPWPVRKEKCRKPGVLGPKGPGRFFRRVDRTSAAPCWMWTGATNSRGYGHLRASSVGLEWRSQLIYAHVAAWILAGREPPAPRQRLYSTCGSQLCVNPEHRSFRQPPLSAEALSRKGVQQLPVETVRAIRDRKARAWSQGQTAKDLGLTVEAVGYVWRRGEQSAVEATAARQEAIVRVWRGRQARGEEITWAAVAGELGITERALEYHLRKLRARGVDLPTDREMRRRVKASASASGEPPEEP